jgi:hypothetical protein
MKETNTQTEDELQILVAKSIGWMQFEAPELWDRASKDLLKDLTAQKAQWQIEAAQHILRNCKSDYFPGASSWNKIIDYIKALNKTRQPSMKKHGSCCACQDCGALYEDCKCEEPSIEKEQE